MATTEHAVLADLTAILADSPVITDPDASAAYRHDQAAWVEGGKPLAVVLAGSTVDVQATLRVATAHRVPVVTRGAGSGLSGGAAALDGCIVLCVAGMDRILEIDPVDQTIEVEPGVINEAVSAAAREHGLWYPPDPASRGFSTIGGNVATNAGGLCCVKYGVTGDYVLGLEVVLADGSLLTTGRRTIKGVAGLDLTRLFVGSEGTLGVVTRARLRLRPLPPPPATVVAFFPTPAAAGRAVAALGAAGVVPSLLELMDRTTVRAVEEWKRMDLDVDAGALLLAQSDAAGPGRDAEVRAVVAACEAEGATYTASTTDPAEGAVLLEARRLAYPALERLGATLLDDVAVPRSRVAELIEVVERIAAEHGVVIGTFGHAGDGNMHPTIVVPHGDVTARAAAGAAFDDIVHAAIRLDGTITGEHGVGSLKHGFLETELGPTAVDVQRRIKAALDPHGILNPGRAL